ncbi:MAG: PSD1 domain-containing protein [Pirellulaceae bacterium]|nr:PSD1 domain-containing protein [Pirellulaceae bacterium]
MILSLLVAGDLEMALGAEPPAATPSFETDIRPLLAAKCFRCHGPEVQKGELSLNSKERLLKGGEGGEILVPGKPEESRLYEMVLKGEMPSDKKNPFSEKEAELLKRWIEGGAKFGGGSEEIAKVTQHDVLPLLLLRCTACHGRSKQEGGLDLRSRESILKGGKSGPVVVLGKPAESLLVKRVAAGEMPPNKRLVEAAVKPMEPDELEKIKVWIAQGALAAPEEVDLAGTANDPLVRPQDRDFWSFKPPVAAKVPDATFAGKANNFIDSFIQQKLQQHKLIPSPEAAPLTLLRRAYFDLTGLPPTPEETAAFLSETKTSPDAFEQLIDRLLASPRYGERWGRHWLDVAGYADCEGRREQHLPRPFAWRYRDYVIRAFNADKPYDRFLLEQLAGDELADYEHAPEITPELEDNLVATAFLRMAPDPTWANLTGFVPDRLEVLADEMDVLGSGVMGLTFKCARCHTHKFDPIPQRDYYRLLAIFKGAYDEHDWLRPEIKGYGGAYSAGPGERYLPFVTTRERQAWQAENDRIDAEIAKLKAEPTTAETDGKMKAFEAQRQPEPRVMALWDRGEPSPMYMYRRGNYQTSGALVGPGVPAVLTSGNEKFEIQSPWPGAKSTGRRLAFAKWLTQPEQPLTSRVFVNRLWKHHFGQGIVKSLGNFGKTGDKPTHPELLDTLAVELMRQDWSPKALHRKMLLSSTWRQSSARTEEIQSRDADGRLLSHMPLRRLEAEPLRDTLQYVAGELDETRFGPAEPVRVQPDGLVLSGKRRSIYVQQLRKQPASLLESFDLPAMNPNCLERSESLVSTQALHLMNDASVRALAEKLAERIIRETASGRLSEVENLYWIVLNRPPTQDEAKIVSASLQKLTLAWEQELAATGQEKSQAPKKALATICHTLLNSADLLYVD